MKNILIVLLVVTLAAGALGAAWYLTKKSKTPKEVGDAQPVTTPTGTKPNTTAVNKDIKGILQSPEAQKEIAAAGKSIKLLGIKI